ncbi:MAG TPA: NAD(P)-binding domain-containing protein [Streptosporangiaceae bacterium]
MTTVGFVGGGRIVETVARLSVAAGHRVVLSDSRGPEALGDLVAELGPLASATTGEQAAAAGDIVMVRTPFGVYQRIPVEPVVGKIVLDACNYDPPRDGNIVDLDAGRVSSSEMLQRHLSESQVVKVFNNIVAKHLRSLTRPHGAADRSALPVAGDDDQAKAAVTGFLDSIGYDAVDTGPLIQSWRQEPGTPVYRSPYGSLSDETGTPADADKIRAALAAARR